MPFPPRQPVPKQQPSTLKSDQSAHSSGQVWVIDQIEEQIASVEVDSRAAVSIPMWMLPRGVHEGDVLRVTIVPDPAEQARRLEQSRQQVAVKSKGDPGGDVTL